MAVRILSTPLSFRVKVSSGAQLIGTNIFVHKYLERFNQTGWDPRLRRSILLKRFVHYCRKTETLYVPGYDLYNFCKFLDNNRVPYYIDKIPLQEGKDIDIRLKPGVKDRSERQTNAISYLTSETSGSLRGLSIGTGQGKSFCTIKTISILKKRAFITVSGLVDQWVRSIHDFMDIDEKDIYIIQGAPSLTKLLTQIDKTIHPKIIMCSLGTLRNYVLDDNAYENYPPADELMDRLRVGVRVIDEAHMNFWLSLITDLRSNAKINIALTATFDRSDNQVKQIFNKHYPVDIRHGEHEYSKHVDIYSYKYTLNGFLLPQKAYITPKGYNHSKFEDYLLRRTPTKLDYIYETVYSPIIFAHYINERKPGQKLLILCSTIDMCKWFEKRLEEDLPLQEKFKINIYISETDDDVLDHSDIIISTPGSAGTGVDIKGLKTCLQTIATGSSVLNKQTLGRLRELPNGEHPIYAYAWCGDITSHQNYQIVRRGDFTQRGHSFTEISLG